MLAACSPEANHLGNPVLLPVHGLTTAIENASYGRRRQQIKGYLQQNGIAMRDEGFRGPVTDSLLQAVPDENVEKVRRQISAVPAGSDFAETATVIIMVHL